MGGQLRNLADFYGVAVRAGAVTPQKQDEEFFRTNANLPNISSEVDDAWEEDDGFRRPVTLKTRFLQRKEEQDLEDNDNADDDNNSMGGS